MDQAWVIPQLLTDHPTARLGLAGSLKLPPFSRGAEPPPLHPPNPTAPLHWGQSPSGLLAQAPWALCWGHQPKQKEILRGVMAVLGLRLIRAPGES